MLFRSFSTNFKEISSKVCFKSLFFIFISYFYFLKVVFLFPGQGAQYIGMGKEISEKYPQTNILWEKTNEIIGYNIKEICFNGLKEKINSTVTITSFLPYLLTNLYSHFLLLFS